MKNPSFHPLRLLSLLTLAVITLLTPVSAQDQNEGAAMLRIVCVTALPGHEEYVIASMDGDAGLKERKRISLRSSFITGWLEVPRGELHLCVREEGKLVSKGDFTFPEDSRKALLTLMPGAAEGEFKTLLIDATDLAFEKGEIMVINSSEKAAEVMLGENQVEAKPGEHSVQKPAVEENGMFRTLVTYKDEAGETVTCTDRYVRGNKSSRGFLILVADPRTGVRAFSMSDFGSYE